MADLFSFLQSNLSLEKQMEDAVQNNEVHRIQELLKKGYNVNSKVQQQGGNTPLHIAARLGHQESVQALLEKGADPLLKNDFNFTPINMGTKSCRKCLELMLSYAKNLPDIDSIWLQFGGSIILWREATDQIIGTLICATPNFRSTRSNVQNNLFYLLQSRKMFHSLKLLVMSGNSFTSEQKTKLENASAEDFLKWLKIYQTQPQTLQHFCRITLRRTFECKVNVFYGVKCLPIPHSLREYICMKAELYSDECEMEVDG